MTEVARWSEPVVGRDVVDGWVGMLVKVEQLSKVIAGTEFVPASLRGRPAAVGAAILAGRELGVGPMTALQHLHVIEGRPSMSAQLMRALVFAHGHSIRVVESTTTRCTMTGRRRDEDEGTTITYTLDDARTAGLDRRPNWQKQPRAMLAARATGELCRLIFADVIGGIGLTVEEAGEIVEDFDRPAPRRRTVQRESPVEAISETEIVAEPESPPEPRTAASEPPTAPQAASPGLVAPSPGEPPARADEPMSREQTGKLFALLAQLEAGEPRERRIEVASGLLGRRVASFATLTVQEASVLIDTLTRVVESERPTDYLAWLVQSGIAHLELVESGAETSDAPVTAGPWGDDEPLPLDPDPDEDPRDG